MLMQQELSFCRACFQAGITACPLHIIRSQISQESGENDKVPAFGSSGLREASAACGVLPECLRCGGYFKIVWAANKATPALVKTGF